MGIFEDLKREAMKRLAFNRKVIAYSRAEQNRALWMEVAYHLVVVGRVVVGMEIDRRRAEKLRTFRLWNLAKL